MILYFNGKHMTLNIHFLKRKKKFHSCLLKQRHGCQQNQILPRNSFSGVLRKKKKCCKKSKKNVHKHLHNKYVQTDKKLNQRLHLASQRLHLHGEQTKKTLKKEFQQKSPSKAG
ncbi:hypothetical protein CEXT_346511 [Caerostris extrusa]|uniref:Uncharacterized protein n=1 Tax=Caerostris extrusa TaxID=172846 RepID=A0AAV4WS42_CAEEX|nr:hypothetical protein CEXT_346511 [Caerostris extrusa]